MSKTCLFAGAAVVLLAAGTPVRRGVRGVRLTLESPDGSARDSRRARMVMLGVPAGAAASAFLPAGPFKATFAGMINVPLRDRYVFTLMSTGTSALEIGGKVVLEPGTGRRSSGKVKLRKGANPFVVRFTSPSTGDARIRLYWQGFDVPFEPLPPEVLTHDATQSDLARGTKQRRGRALVAALRCPRCHAAGGHTEMAEVVHGLGPSLAGIGSRLAANWIRKWIEDPTSLRRNARMPHVLTGEPAAVKRDARDIAAWLAEQEGGASAKAGPGNAKAGGEIFAQLGCVGCHTRPDAKQPFSDATRIPLAWAGAKFKSAATLAAFLRAPSEHWSWIRMPDFALDRREAADLAAFLTAKSRQLPPSEAGGDAGRGKTLFVDRGCAACHEVVPGADTQAPQAPSFGDALDHLDRGCTMTKHENGPAYGLDDRARADIASLAGIEAPFGRHVAAEFAERQVDELRCFACHRFDGREELWKQLEAETRDIAAPKPKQEASQRRPTLTWFGEKLQADWTRRFLAGDLAYRPRPWLRARMPRFASRAALLARGLAHDHGVPVRAEPRQPSDSARAKVGRWLAGRKGFSCNLCHDVGDDPAKEVFEAHGVNFSIVTQRLRREFYNRWMMNPNTIEPGTRMPMIPDEDGLTHFDDIYGGDARKQFDALWQYLLLGPKIPPVDETDR